MAGVLRSSWATALTVSTTTRFASAAGGPYPLPCAHCGCKVVGHGVAVEDVIFCCARCATQHGMAGPSDRV